MVWMMVDMLDAYLVLMMAGLLVDELAESLVDYLVVVMVALWEYLWAALLVDLMVVVKADMTVMHLAVMWAS